MQSQQFSQSLCRWQHIIITIIITVDRFQHKCYVCVAIQEHASFRLKQVASIARCKVCMLWTCAYSSVTCKKCQIMNMNGQQQCAETQ